MTANTRNLLYLLVKELRSLWHDKGLLLFIAFAFTVGIYSAGTAKSQEMHLAPIAIVDEDRSPLSSAISDAFYEPYFLPPDLVTFAQIEPLLEQGIYTFVLVIPHGFQGDVQAGKQPSLQLNIDATRMSQAGIGASYIQQIVQGELQYFLNNGTSPQAPVELIQHNRFNPNLTSMWFGSIMEMINNITLLAIIISGAALIREREHGTLEHLLTLPVTPLQIVGAKVLSAMLVISIGACFALLVTVHTVLGVPLQGSIALFLLGTVLHLFAACSMGIFLGIIARSMPQLGLLLIMVILPLQLLSGAMTPKESMPEVIQHLMLATPNLHFVSFAQLVLFRSAGWLQVWPQLVGLAAIGTVFFFIAAAKFRKAITQGTD